MKKTTKPTGTKATKHPARLSPYKQAGITRKERDTIASKVMSGLRKP